MSPQEHEATAAQLARSAERLARIRSMPLQTDIPEILDILGELSKQNVTWAALQESKIKLEVNNRFLRKHENAEVQEKSVALMSRWRELREPGASPPVVAPPVAVPPRPPGRQAMQKDSSGAVLLDEDESEDEEKLLGEMRKLKDLLAQGKPEMGQAATGQALALSPSTTEGASATPSGIEEQVSPDSPQEVPAGERGNAIAAGAAMSAAEYLARCKVAAGQLAEMKARKREKSDEKKAARKKARKMLF